MARQRQNEARRRSWFPDSYGMLVRRPGCGAEIFLPTTSTLPQVTAGRPIGTFSAWTAIATPVNDFYVSRLQARRTAIPLAVNDFDVEFAYGAAPVALDALRGITPITDPNLVFNIVSSTNAAPIQITVASTVGLSAGTTVVVANHLVNTAANGTWTISNVTATTFTLDTTTGNGVGGATGTVTRAGNDAGWCGADLTAPFLRVPAGQSLQFRVSESASAGQTWEASVLGWDGAPPPFQMCAYRWPSGAGRYYPTNTTSTSFAPGVMPAYGAWTQFISPAPNDLLVVSAHQAGNSATQALSAVTVAQVGIGVAGNEIPVATTMSGHATPTINIDPPILLLKGERLALRTGSAGGSRAYAVKVYDL